MSILCKEIKKIIPLIQTINEDMHRMEHSRSESCLSPERKRNKMLIFFSWLLTGTHAQAWLLNLSHRRNFGNFSLLPRHRCILPPSLLPLFSFFFHSYIFRPFLAVWPFPILFLLLPLHPFLPTPSPFSSHPFSVQLQKSPLSFPPYYCCVSFQTTVNFCAHIVQIPYLFYMWPVFGAVAPVVSAVSKQKTIYLFPHLAPRGGGC